MTEGARETPKRGAMRYAWLLPVVVISFMALDQFVLTRFYAPQEHAERPRCIGPVDGLPPWENTCAKPQNFRYCVLSSDNRDVCRDHALAPGEGVPQADIDSALAELGGGFVNIRRIACEAPFIPIRQRHPNNGRLQDACGKPV